MTDGDSRLAQDKDGASRTDLRREGPIGVVIAGAAARGPYEAGVLAELMPRLFARKSLREAMLLGTSSGAVNAGLWAHFADGQRTLSEVGDAVCDFWVEFDQPKVFRFNLQSVVRIGRVDAFLDISPLKRNAPAMLGLPNLTSALGKGQVGTFGAVATSCAEDASGGRSAVFYNGNARVPVQQPGGSFDYVRTEVTLEHVFASAAIPVLFPAMEVTQPERARGFYTDGGVRLNTPISVALDLGAERIVVVSSHATTYPTAPAIAKEQPDVVDVSAQALHSLLADEMVEDLRRLKRTNALIESVGHALSAQGGKIYRKVELIEASPSQNLLAELARDILFQPAPTCRERLIRSKYKAFRLALSGVGRGSGNDELLSYVFFDKAYARAQIALGREEGKRAAERGWGYG